MLECVHYLVIRQMVVRREIKKGKRSHVCQCVGLSRAGVNTYVLVFCVYHTDNSHKLLFDNFHFNTFIFLYVTFSLLHSIISFFDQLMSNVLFIFFFAGSCYLSLVELSSR